MPEQKESRSYTIIVIDEEFDIPECVIKKIPFFETLVTNAKIDKESQISKKIPFLGILVTDAKLDKKPQIIEQVSPDFFRLLISFLKSGKNVSYFKDSLNNSEFDREQIEIWLKYLLMDVLLRQLYGCDRVDGRQVITTNILSLYRPNRYDDLETYYGFELCSGKIVTKIDANAVMLIQGTKCEIDGIQSLIVKSYKNKQGDQGNNLPITNFLERDGLFFVPVEVVIKYFLIEDLQKRTHLAKILSEQNKIKEQQPK